MYYQSMTDRTVPTTWSRRMAWVFASTAFAIALFPEDRTCPCLRLLDAEAVEEGGIVDLPVIGIGGRLHGEGRRVGIRWQHDGDHGKAVFARKIEVALVMGRAAEDGAGAVFDEHEIGDVDGQRPPRDEGVRHLDPKPVPALLLRLDQHQGHAVAPVFGHQLGAGMGGEMSRSDRRYFGGDRAALRLEELSAREIITLVVNRLEGADYDITGGEPLVRPDLPEILAAFPNVVYIVLGATHPNLVREHGEAYRTSLERLAKKNKVHPHVIFYNRFVELEELKEFIGAADLYVTPYLNEAQITSGTLAYAFGAGKAVSALAQLMQEIKDKERVPSASRRRSR